MCAGAPGARGSSHRGRSEPSWRSRARGGAVARGGGAIGRQGLWARPAGRAGGMGRRPSQIPCQRRGRVAAVSRARAWCTISCVATCELGPHAPDAVVATMTVEVCSRVGVRVSAAPGAIKDESQPGGGTSPAHETSEAPTPRPKFMITDILAQHKPPTSTQSEASAPPTPIIEEPKDLSLTRTHAEDDDIDLEGDASHDEDDHTETGESSFTKLSSSAFRAQHPSASPSPTPSPPKHSLPLKTHPL